MREPYVTQYVPTFRITIFIRPVFVTFLSDEVTDVLNISLYILVPIDHAKICILFLAYNFLFSSIIQIPCIFFSNR